MRHVECAEDVTVYIGAKKIILDVQIQASIGAILLTCDTSDVPRGGR